MDIPIGVEIEEYMSLRRSLSKVYTTEALNTGLDGSVVEANNHAKKRENSNGGEADLSMLATYTQVGNGLGLRLMYLEDL